MNYNKILKIIFDENSQIDLEKLSELNLNDSQVEELSKILTDMNFEIRETTDQTMAEELELSDDRNFSQKADIDILELYIQEISKFKLLSKQEEQDLFRRVKAGDKSARTSVIDANLRLVLYVAKKYFYKISGLDPLDVIGEGNKALIKAVDTFNPELGIKFSTYGTLLINRQIIRGIQELSRTIRVSVHQEEKIYKYKKDREKLNNEYGRGLTKEELSKEMGIKKKEIANIELSMCPIENLNQQLSTNKYESTLLDIIPDNTQIPVEDIVLYKMMREFFALDPNFTKMERRVLLGMIFTNNTPIKFADMAKKYGISKQRIDQIKSMTIRKLRKNACNYGYR